MRAGAGSAHDLTHPHACTTRNLTAESNRRLRHGNRQKPQPVQPTAASSTAPTLATHRRRSSLLSLLSASSPPTVPRTRNDPTRSAWAGSGRQVCHPWCLWCACAACLHAHQSTDLRPTAGLASKRLVCQRTTDSGVRTRICLALGQVEGHLAHEVERVLGDAGGCVSKGRGSKQGSRSVRWHSLLQPGAEQEKHD